MLGKYELQTVTTERGYNYWKTCSTIVMENLVLMIISFLLIFHISITDATPKINSNSTFLKKRNWLTIVIVEKPRPLNFEVYLAKAGNPFDISEKASSIYNGTSMVVNFKKENHSDNVGKQIKTFEKVFQNDTRSKRGVFGLFNMISCATGCNPFMYKRYGCYCGFLGSGYEVDGIDECCKIHDWCYSAADCPMWSEYFVPYHWICFHKRPLCALQHGEWGGPNSCAYKLCDCDKKLAECLSQYPCPSSRAVCTSSPLRLLQNILR